MTGIYKIIAPSGKIYIGQSRNIKQRVRKHRQAIGKESVVLHELPPDVSQKVMDNYEQLYIEQYKSAGFEMLNISEGGKSYKMNEGTKKKLSENRVGKFAGENHPLYGKPRTEEVKAALRKANLGKKASEETKKKLSALRQGIKRKKFSEEAKQKMRTAALNRSDQAKQNIINAIKKRFGKNA